MDVIRYTAIQDAGKAIHPSYVEGQMQGGAVQGIGWALNEEYVFDEQGVMQNASFLDYRMPVALDLPMIDTVDRRGAEPEPSLRRARRRRDADRAAARRRRQRDRTRDGRPHGRAADVAAAAARGARARGGVIHVVIPSGLQQWTGGAAHVDLVAKDVRGAVAALDTRFPGFAGALGRELRGRDRRRDPPGRLARAAAGGERAPLPARALGRRVSEVIAHRFEAPRRVEDAVALLTKHGAAARLLAGGTDLLAQMKTGTRRPAVIVDLKRIDELMQVREAGGGLVIGAAAPAAVVREHPTLRRWFPGLAEAAALIGSEQIQGRASLGGNLCNASPAADTTPALLVNDARVEIAGPSGRRTAPVAAVCTAPGRTSLAAGELLLSIVLAAPPPRSADAYLRLIPRTEMDIAVVGAAVRVTLARRRRLSRRARRARRRVADGDPRARSRGRTRRHSRSKPPRSRVWSRRCAPRRARSTTSAARSPIAGR